MIMYMRQQSNFEQIKKRHKTLVNETSSQMEVQDRSITRYIFCPMLENSQNYFTDSA